MLLYFYLINSSGLMADSDTDSDKTITKSDQLNIRYKKCRQHRIVVLEVDLTESNNEKRNNITNYIYAKYRYKKVTIRKIFDMNNEDITFDTAICLRDEKFVYTVGQTIIVENYDPDLEQTCAPGIHGFISLIMAKSFGEKSILDGLYIVADERGNVQDKYLFENGFIVRSYQLENRKKAFYGQKCKIYNELGDSVEFEVHYSKDVRQKLVKYFRGSILFEEIFTDGVSLAENIPAIATNSHQYIIIKKSGTNVFTFMEEIDEYVRSCQIKQLQ